MSLTCLVPRGHRLAMPPGLVPTVPTSVLGFMTRCGYRTTMMFSIPSAPHFAVAMIAPSLDAPVIAMFPRPTLALVVTIPFVPFNPLVTFPLLVAIVIIRCRSHRRAEHQGQDHRR